MSKQLLFVNNGREATVKAGFSWTVFFIGPWVFAYRRMWMMFFLTLAAGLVTQGMSQLVFAFFANEWYAQFLRKQGWTFAGNEKDIPPTWNFDGV